MALRVPFLENSPLYVFLKGGVDCVYLPLLHGLVGFRDLLEGSYQGLLMPWIGMA